MNIVDLPCKEIFINKIKYSDQIEVLLDILIESGRRCTMEDRFTMTHADVVIVLELIRGRLTDIKDL